MNVLNYTTDIPECDNVPLHWLALNGMKVGKRPVGAAHAQITLNCQSVPARLLVPVVHAPWQTSLARRQFQPLVFRLVEQQVC